MVFRDNNRNETIALKNYDFISVAFLLKSEYTICKKYLFCAEQVDFKISNYTFNKYHILFDVLEF
jgi:hypothetical protein